MAVVHLKYCLNSNFVINFFNFNNKYNKLIIIIWRIIKNQELY